ncbi:MAG: primosomal protein N' [Tannerella sp.]|jgi:primosomal protein N' (replication factor Y)|nr:primosomal protein N' [Tannerella sp.]
MKYAEVILPLPLENTYTYRIPNEMLPVIQPNCRVIVSFGKKRYYTGIVKEIHEQEPDSSYAVKEIFALLDETPILCSKQVGFWEWLASYYLCKLGDVYKAAVPSGLKLESETIVSYIDDFEAEEPLSKREQAILDAFSGKSHLSVAELEKSTGLHNMIPLLNLLMSKGAVSISEELKRGFVPKTETYVRLSDNYSKEEDLTPVFGLLKRAKKQEELLLFYLHLAQPFQPESKDVSKKFLLEESGQTAAVLDGLIKRGILVCYNKEISRLAYSSGSDESLNKLTKAQYIAYNEIRKSFQSKFVCLLHGVPSCGKTEIYLHLISDTLKQGKQVLYLLPEIAVTTHLTERLSRALGNKLLVYHSGFSDHERVEIWNRLLHSKEPMVILGVRSSLFLPFSNLGLVIVDEEQEPSYKQQDPAPRYHARNAAIMLAYMHNGKALLGSATPSLDSYFNARTGKYGFVSLDTRFGEAMMPEIHLVNVRELRRKKVMKAGLFSPLLKDTIGEALQAGEQVLLFQNRRGFAPMMVCNTCAKVPHCLHCDVSLTYHKRTNRLVCHYCGYSIPLPAQCPSCGSKDIKLVGFGTEKVEEEISMLFPDAKTERLDMDTARTRRAYERILADFRDGKSDILVGTQMLAKGLDFEQVSVVGVLNADSLMNYPDFRAHERAFQLMLQVSGRAGCRHKQGTVIIQTSQSEHVLLQMVQSFDYANMTHLHLSERKMFKYPPYSRLITLILRSRNELVLGKMSAIYATTLKRELKAQVFGPFVPPVTRVQTLHIRQIMLKLELSMPILSIREILDSAYQQMQVYPEFRQIILHYDVEN